jgi:hypothetical protein
VLEYDSVTYLMPRLRKEVRKKSRGEKSILENLTLIFEGDELCVGKR